MERRFSIEFGGGKKMNRKIISILVCMLMIVTSLSTINIFSNVKGAKNPPENSLILLDANYIWNWTKSLANITYDAYHQEEITRIDIHS